MNFISHVPFPPVEVCCAYTVKERRWQKSSRCQRQRVDSVGLAENIQQWEENAAQRGIDGLFVIYFSEASE
jgi:hypothetical protein